MSIVAKLTELLNGTAGDNDPQDIRKDPNILLRPGAQVNPLNPVDPNSATGELIEGARRGRATTERERQSRQGTNPNLAIPPAPNPNDLMGTGKELKPGPPRKPGRGARILEGLSGEAARQRRIDQENERRNRARQKREKEEAARKRGLPPAPYATWEAYENAQKQAEEKKKSATPTPPAGAPKQGTPRRTPRRRTAAAPQQGTGTNAAPSTEPKEDNVVYGAAPPPPAPSIGSTTTTTTTGVAPVAPSGTPAVATPNAAPAGGTAAPDTNNTPGVVPTAPGSTTMGVQPVPPAGTAPSGTTLGGTTAQPNQMPGLNVPGAAPGAGGGAPTVRLPPPSAYPQNAYGNVRGINDRGGQGLPPEAYYTGNLLTTGLPESGPPPPDRRATDLPGIAPGMRAPGTIDVTRQPRLKNPDGTVSTVESFSIGTDEGEVLLPMIRPDGYRFGSQEEAKEAYRRGEIGHLGIFDTPENATAYAKQLSARQGTAPERPLQTEVDEQGNVVTVDAQGKRTPYGIDAPKPRFAVSPDAIRLGGRLTNTEQKPGKKGKVTEKVTQVDANLVVQDGKVYTEDGQELGTIEEYAQKDKRFRRSMRRMVAEARGDEVELAKIELEEVKDRAKDTKRNWKDFFKGLGLGALRGFATGGIGGAIGGALTGGVGSVINPDFDDQMQDAFMRLPRAQQRYQTAVDQAADAAKIRKANREADIQEVQLTRDIISANMEKLTKDPRYIAAKDSGGFLSEDDIKGMIADGVPGASSLRANVSFESQMVVMPGGYLARLGKTGLVTAAYKMNPDGSFSAIKYPSKAEATVEIGGKAFPTTGAQAAQMAFNANADRIRIVENRIKDVQDFEQQRELKFLEASLREAQAFREFQLRLAEIKGLTTGDQAIVDNLNAEITKMEQEMEAILKDQASGKPFDPTQWKNMGISEVLKDYRTGIANYKLELTKALGKVKGNTVLQEALQTFIDTPTDAQLMTTPVAP